MATARSLQLKEDGNKAFQSADYPGADAYYSKALILDATNPLLWTNRAMARLKLRSFDAVVSDCDESLKLLPENMKAHYYKSQALLELSRSVEAEKEAREAYTLCQRGGDKGWERSLGSVAGLVLKSKKAVWEVRENDRLRQRTGLLEECIKALQASRKDELVRLAEGHDFSDPMEVNEKESQREKIIHKWENKIAELKRIWERGVESEEKRREVPDWAIDDITFGIMIDPVMTKTGNSYDRASITEHLRRSHTDPLTREPLTVAELRPNLGLKKACEEFLEANGWAVDW